MMSMVVSTPNVPAAVPMPAEWCPVGLAAGLVLSRVAYRSLMTSKSYEILPREGGKWHEATAIAAPAE